MSDEHEEAFLRAAARPLTASEEAGKATAMHAPPDEPTWEQMWRVFRDAAGDITAEDLARECDVPRQVAFAAINRGWPQKRLPALRDRLELYTKQEHEARARALADADRQEAEAAGVEKARVWRTFFPKAAAQLIANMETMGALGAKLRRATDVASFVRYRVVKKLGENGKVTAVSEAYVDGIQIAKACALLAQAAREQTSTMTALTGGRALPDEPAVEFTPEQVEILSRGELPPGVSAEQVARAVLQLGVRTL